MNSITVDELIDYLDDVVRIQINLEEARGVHRGMKTKLQSAGRFPAEPVKGKPIINIKALVILNVFLFAPLLSLAIVTHEFVPFLALVGGQIYYIVNRVNLNNKSFEVEMQLYQDDITERRRLTSSLQQSIPDVNSAISSCQSTLSQLYQLGYLHSDYWNLPACATFLEWFDKGMTSSLGRNGTDPGAYVMYEEKLRSGEIIDRLDRIEGRLSEISNTQRILASAVTEIDRTVKDMNAKLSNIEFYTTITAFASSITSYNTSTLPRYFPEPRRTY